jgi:hypothetical protein
MQRPYDQLRATVNAARNRRRWRIPVIGVGILIGLGMFVYLNARGFSLTETVAALLWGLLGAVLVLIAVLALQLLNSSEAEQQLVERALLALSQHRYPDAVIDAINARAEVGASAGQVRTLLPLLIIPLAAPLFSLLPALDLTSSALALLVIALPVSAFLVEIDRATTDGIIRHAIAEYRCGLQLQREAQQRLADAEAWKVAWLLDTQATRRR